MFTLNQKQIERFLTEICADKKTGELVFDRVLFSLQIVFRSSQRTLGSHSAVPVFKVEHRQEHIITHFIFELKSCLSTC